MLISRGMALAPLRNWRFWLVTGVCAAVVGAQMFLDSHSFHIFPDSVIPALLILPILYGALRFGFVGSTLLTAWVTILWLPDFVTDYSHGEFLDMSGDIVMIGVVVAVGMFAGWRMQREHDLNDAYSAAREKVEAYAQTVLSSLEEERSRIARELHDETLQTLIQLGRKISSVAKSSEIPLDAKEAFIQSRQLVDESVRRLREVVKGLRPPALQDLGLEVALSRLAEDVSNEILDVEFEEVGSEPLHLPDDIELALYRIAQEALSNVQRHSRARHGYVRLRFGGSGVELEVADDGIGFPVSDDFLIGGSNHQGVVGVYHGEHFGMLGMHERAQPSPFPILIYCYCAPT